MSPRSNHGQLRRMAAGGRAGRFLWVLAALGSVSLLGLATAEGLTRLHLPRTATFTGHLKDTARTQVLMLPKGVDVQGLLVREGARTTKGQKLVQFDLASVVTAIGRLQDQLAADAQLLACLLASSSPSASFPLGLLTAASPGDAKPALWPAASRDCALVFAPHVGALQALDADDALVAARSALIDRRIKLEVAQVHALASTRIATARLVLGLAWEQTRLEKELAENQERRSTIATARAVAVAERIRRVRASLDRDQTGLAALAQLQQEPYLTSPVDAIILDAKQTTPGQVYDIPVALIQFVPTAPQRFEVRLAVPASATLGLTEDAVVSIELIGTAMRWPLLTGHVTGFEPASVPGDPEALQVRIALEPESAAALGEMSARSGFVRDGSAIAVQVVMPDQAFVAAMITAIEDVASLTALP